MLSVHTVLTHVLTFPKLHRRTGQQHLSSTQINPDLSEREVIILTERDPRHCHHYSCDHGYGVGTYFHRHIHVQSCLFPTQLSEEAAFIGSCQGGLNFQRQRLLYPYPYRGARIAGEQCKTLQLDSLVAEMHASSVPLQLQQQAFVLTL